ncbi:M15 family metallopeptidase [Adonisia turfae]
MSGFHLSQRSLDRLEGVHPDLVRVVKRAIGVTEVDFTVLEGLRSRDRQHKLVKSGASKTMNSRHLTGHAVDLGAFVGGTVRWDWPLYYRIAKAMQDASIDEAVPLVWGGAWGRYLAVFSSPEAASDAYVAERRAQGRRPFMDGPHYELPWDFYPVEAVA